MNGKGSLRRGADRDSDARYREGWDRIFKGLAERKKRKRKRKGSMRW
jgi:hypothetical protein